MPRQGNRPRVEIPKPRIDPKVATIAANLVNEYGYPKMDAREIAREIAQNLKNYLAIMERPRVPYNTASPTQTPYWKGSHG